LGCELSCEESTSSTCVEPVYLTWEELRKYQSPIYGDTQTLTTPGKVYVKDQYLFVIDQYRGVHIFDQTDPQNPMRILFLPVVGATDISVKDNVMYLNAFTDLVVVNIDALIDGPFTSNDLSRIEYKFDTPNSRTFLPEGYEFKSDTDFKGWVRPYYYSDDEYPEKGFIIGFKDTDGSDIIFGEYDEQAIIKQQGGKA